MKPSLHLTTTLFRFEGAEVIRARLTYFIVLTAILVVLGAVVIPTGREGSAAPPLLFILGHWAIAAPLCRSWLDEDVREGYAGLWLQKPISALDFYSARLIALLLWSLVASVIVCLAAGPGYALSGSLRGVSYLLVGSGWIPPLLAVLSFLGSGLGARAGGVFAFGVLFAAFALRGIADAWRLGPVYELLSLALPPIDAVLDAAPAAQAVGLPSALTGLWPLVVYGLGCAALGLVLSLRVPSRLARAG